MTMPTACSRAHLLHIECTEAAFSVPERLVCRWVSFLKLVGFRNKSVTKPRPTREAKICTAVSKATATFYTFQLNSEGRFPKIGVAATDADIPSHRRYFNFGCKLGRARHSHMRRTRAHISDLSSVLSTPVALRRARAAVPSARVYKGAAA